MMDRVMLAVADDRRRELSRNGRLDRTGTATVRTRVRRTARRLSR